MNKLIWSSNMTHNYFLHESKNKKKDLIETGYSEEEVDLKTPDKIINSAEFIDNSAAADRADYENNVKPCLDGQCNGYLALVGDDFNEIISTEDLGNKECSVELEGNHMTVTCDGKTATIYTIPLDKEKMRNFLDTCMDGAEDFLDCDFVNCDWSQVPNCCDKAIWTEGDEEYHDGEGKRVITEGSQDIVQLLKDFCDEYDYSYMGDYSGRYMYGELCVGVIGSEYLPADLTEFLLERGFKGASSFVKSARRDNMGLQYIYYWPGVQDPEYSDEYEDVIPESLKKSKYASEFSKKLDESSAEDTINRITHKYSKIKKAPPLEEEDEVSTEKVINESPIGGDYSVFEPEVLRRRLNEIIKSNRKFSWFKSVLEAFRATGERGTLSLFSGPITNYVNATVEAKRTKDIYEVIVSLYTGGGKNDITDVVTKHFSNMINDGPAVVLNTSIDEYYLPMEVKKVSKNLLNPGVIKYISEALADEEAIGKLAEKSIKPLDDTLGYATSKRQELKQFGDDMRTIAKYGVEAGKKAINKAGDFITKADANLRKLIDDSNGVEAGSKYSFRRKPEENEDDQVKYF